MCGLTIPYRLAWRGMCGLTIPYRLAWRGMCGLTIPYRLAWRGMCGLTIPYRLAWRGMCGLTIPYRLAWRGMCGLTIPYRLAWYGMWGVIMLQLCPTPGTGKSLTASEVCSRTEMRHVDVGQVAKQQNLYDGFDKQYQCPILDEDKVCVEC